MIPACRFGAVPFDVIRPRGRTLADWQPDLRITEHHFPGSNLVEVQSHGFGLMAVTYTLRFDSEQAFTSFMAHLGTEQTLRIPHNATAYAGDREGATPAGLYKEFDAVLATNPVSDVQRRPNGTVTVDVTFKRRMP